MSITIITMARRTTSRSTATTAFGESFAAGVCPVS
jgi:hypothetical protein